ncbi:MAG: phosphoribosyl-AMP cyclohydrolase [Thermodesulfovibrionaceae bacterium]
MIPELKFDEDGLIPAVVQEVDTKEVLMVAYMDKEALKKTLQTGYTHFWSRSRKKYWMKGETSGNIQEVRAIYYDCDEDTLLILVKQHGFGACHTGNRTCFYRSIDFTKKE